MPFFIIFICPPIQLTKEILGKPPLRFCSSLTLFFYLRGFLPIRDSLASLLLFRFFFRLLSVHFSCTKGWVFFLCTLIEFIVQRKNLMDFKISTCMSPEYKFTKLYGFIFFNWNWDTFFFYYNSSITNLYIYF